jgi:hypothetical protein
MNLQTFIVYFLIQNHILAEKEKNSAHARNFYVFHVKLHIINIICANILKVNRAKMSFLSFKKFAEKIH